jgi:23S rRNA-/tRNA-specific pseudouridylate synthase
MYNTTLVEVEQLRKELKRKEDEQKAKDKMIQQMQEQMELNTKELQEIGKLTRLQDVLKKLDITKLHKLFEVPDEDINGLYLEYLTDKAKKSGLAYIFEQDNKLIIPKAYYVVENEGGCK